MGRAEKNFFCPFLPLRTKNGGVKGQAVVKYVEKIFFLTETLVFYSKIRENKWQSRIHIAWIVSPWAETGEEWNDKADTSSPFGEWELDAQAGPSAESHFYNRAAAKEAVITAVIKTYAESRFYNHAETKAGEKSKQSTKTLYEVAKEFIRVIQK